MMDDEQQMEAEMEAELCGAVRNWARVVTGGNCSFVDDDVKMLGRLAQRAVAAGLIEGISTDPHTMRNLAKRRAMTRGTGT